MFDSKSILKIPAIIFCILGISGILFSLLRLPQIISNPEAYPIKSFEFGNGYYFIFSFWLGYFVLGIINFICAYGIFKFKKWSYPLSIIVGLLNSFVFLIMGILGARMFIWFAVFPLTVGLSVYIYVKKWKIT